MTAAQLINVLYSVVDRIYLGRLPGHLALTGLGLTLPIISIVMGFANLCGTGGAPLCSIYRGKGEEEEAERIMGNAFTLLLISAPLSQGCSCCSGIPCSTCSVPVTPPIPMPRRT